MITNQEKAQLDALEGRKFFPAEREDIEKIVSSVGIQRVKSWLAVRDDISGDQFDPSADLVAMANKALRGSNTDDIAKDVSSLFDSYTGPEAA